MKKEYAKHDVLKPFFSYVCSSSKTQPHFGQKSWMGDRIASTILYSVSLIFSFLQKLT